MIWFAVEFICSLFSIYTIFCSPYCLLVCLPVCLPICSYFCLYFCLSVCVTIVRLYYPHVNFLAISLMVTSSCHTTCSSFNRFFYSSIYQLLSVPFSENNWLCNLIFLKKMIILITRRNKYYINNIYDFYQRIINTKMKTWKV